jgi:hypothetical protein
MLTSCRTPLTLFEAPDNVAERAIGRHVQPNAENVSSAGLREALEALTGLGAAQSRDRVMFVDLGPGRNIGPLPRTSTPVCGVRRRRCRSHSGPAGCRGWPGPASAIAPGARPATLSPLRTRGRPVLRTGTPARTWRTSRLTTCRSCDYRTRPDSPGWSARTSWRSGRGVHPGAAGRSAAVIRADYASIVPQPGARRR